MSKGTVFVTGGSGFIGSVVVRRLVARGYNARLLLRETSKTDRLEGVSFEKAIGDVRSLESLERGMKNCVGVLHLASLSSWSDIHSPAMKDVVLTGTENVLKAAEANGKLKTVFVSSTLAVNGSEQPKVFNEDTEFVFDNSDLVYSKFKLEAEKICHDAHARGLPVVIVNPAEVYGPNDTGMITAKNLIDFAKSWPVLVCNGGTAVVHVEDVADGIIAAFEKGRSGQRYILGGENLTIRQLAQLTVELVGKKKPTVTFPNSLMRALTKAATAVRAEKLLPYEAAVVPYATRYWFVDSSKAQRELGVRFRPAREVLEPTIGWLKAAGYIN